MKKILVTISLMTLIFSIAVGQTNKRTSAYMYNKNQQYDKAKEAIDEAIHHAKTENDAKTWMYRGIIYFNIANSTDEAVKALAPDAAEISYDSFLKSKELDEKKQQDVETSLYLNQLTNIFYQRGAEDFQKPDYPGAIKNFEIAYKIAETDGRLDTVAAFNIGMSGVYSEDKALAETTMPYLKTCIDANFKEPRVYLFYARLQKQTGDTTAAFATIEKGRELFPQESSLQLEQSQLYLETGQNEKLISNLKEAIAADPTNENLYRVLGQTYENVDDKVSAIEYYIKAIEINPDFGDAIFNLGAIYVNDAAELYTEANNLPFEEQKKYDELKKEADANLNKALPYLERSLELNPDDQIVISALREAYANLKMNDKLKELSEKE
ncbi:MAG: tetratricopeptide repeat protein [Bacteroidales bacterium]|nr:tetratricopeptide repeat protein [Bacteroidales bacterium]